jgi:hypothetical protein
VAKASGRNKIQLTAAREEVTRPILTPVFPIASPPGRIVKKVSGHGGLSLKLKPGDIGFMRADFTQVSK